MPRAPGSGWPPDLLGLGVSFHFSCGIEQQGLDWIFADATFRRDFFRRDYSRWADLSGRAAGLWDARSQLWISPPQVLGVDAHPFSERGRPQFYRGSACI